MPGRIRTGRIDHNSVVQALLQSHRPAQANAQGVAPIPTSMAAAEAQ